TRPPSRRRWPPCVRPAASRRARAAARGRRARARGGGAASGSGASTFGLPHGAAHCHRSLRRAAARAALETAAALRHAGPMIDRVVDRLPALLLLAVVALGAHVAIIEANDWRLLTASVPAFLLFVLYLRSGPGTGGGGKG